MTTRLCKVSATIEKFNIKSRIESEMELPLSNTATINTIAKLVTDKMKSLVDEDTKILSVSVDEELER